MKLGHGELSVRQNNVAALCRVCAGKIVKDHVYGTFEGSQEYFNFHRSCIKAWLEHSYDVLSMTRQEIEADPTGNTARVEIERGKREFAEYRQALLDRLVD